MKILFVIIILIVSVVTMAQVYISKYSSRTEQHKYEVIKSYDKFEIRRYVPALFSSVILEKKGYKENSGEGFRILAGYIFGGNESNEKIAMTSPVAMELGDTSKMMFMVPESYQLENLPTPNNSKIVFEKKEEKIMAAIQFGGWADDEKIEKYKAILIKELDSEKLIHNGKFTFLGYNAPFELTNRRNEITVGLVDYK